MSTADMTPAEKFQHYASTRSGNALKAIDLLGNLSNERDYDWTQEEVETIFAGIAQAADASLDRFKAAKRWTEDEVEPEVDEKDPLGIIDPDFDEDDPEQVGFAPKVEARPEPAGEAEAFSITARINNMDATALRRLSRYIDRRLAEIAALDAPTTPEAAAALDDAIAGRAS